MSCGGSAPSKGSPLLLLPGMLARMPDAAFFCHCEEDFSAGPAPVAGEPAAAPLSSQLQLRLGLYLACDATPGLALHAVVGLISCLLSPLPSPSAGGSSPSPLLPGEASWGPVPVPQVRCVPAGCASATDLCRCVFGRVVSTDVESTVRALLTSGIQARALLLAGGTSVPTRGWSRWVCAG